MAEGKTMAELKGAGTGLAGLRVLVTRPAPQAAKLSRALSQESAVPVEAPLAAIRPCQDEDGAIEEALRSLASYDWLIFTSVNGVDVFFDALARHGLDSGVVQGRSVAAIGPATAQALEQRGIPVALMPGEYRTTGIVKAMGRFDLRGKRVLLPRAEEGNPELPSRLKALGAEARHLTLYRTELPPDARQRVLQALDQGLDMATFTSPSTVRNMAEALEGHVELLGPVVLACIGPVTAEAAREAGMKPQVVASEHTIRGLVQALKDFCQNCQMERIRQW